MRILATFPGRAGDLLWALPTVRAVSEHFGVPVDLQIAGEFAGLVPLLAEQAYLGTITADPRWNMDGLPPPVLVPTHAGLADPSYLTDHWDRVYHLGYPGWPARPLPFETEATLHAQWRPEDEPAPLADLDRPWITVAPWTRVAHRVALGWSDCWFELKVGLVKLLTEHWVGDPLTAVILPPAGSRWTTEQPYEGVGWLEAAQRIAAAQVFLGDCSALHVLAVALGKPVVCYEPMEARHNDIFYPLGTHDRVRLVRGGDGLPTTDARHTAETLQEVLRG